MKDITVLLRLEPYLRQWLTHAFGEPVRFPAQSYENHLLLRLVQRVPRALGWSFPTVRIAVPNTTTTYRDVPTPRCVQP